MSPTPRYWSLKPRAPKTTLMAMSFLGHMQHEKSSVSTQCLKGQLPFIEAEFHCTVLAILELAT